MLTARRRESFFCLLEFAMHQAQAQPHVTLIGVPTDVGASRLGAAMGPDALRVAQLGPALAQLGVQVHDIGNLAGPPNPRGERDDAGMRNLAECLAWNQLTHDAVWQALQQGRLPIMLGGDHVLATGSISAVARHCAPRASACACCGWMRIRTATRPTTPPAVTCTACPWPACAGWGRRL